MRLVAVPFVTLLALLTWSEWIHWKASGRRFCVTTRPVGREVIIVPGFKNRGHAANYVNRYRVRAALRSIDPAADESVLVFCGGSVGSTTSEAELLRAFAVQHAGYEGPLRLDTHSVSTWQNIQNAIPLIEGFDTIKIASNSLHAEKARAFLWKQRPDLAARLVRANEYRPGEIVLMKPIMAIVGLRGLRRLR